MVEAQMADEPTGWQHCQPVPVVVVISGPSGVGKDSVLDCMKKMAYPFHFVVTATNRAARPGEVDGVDYHFITTAAFEEMLAKDELLEHATVYDQYKGVPKWEVREALASGQDVIMRLDVQGAARIRQLIPNAVLIFLTTTTEEELVHRLRARHSDTEEQARIRIETARQELCKVQDFDYCLLNAEGQLEETARQIAAIITAERLHVGRKPVQL
jgi:guanylate kinase